MNKNDEEKHNQKVYKRRGFYDRGLYGAAQIFFPFVKLITRKMF